ncbi:MAG: GvpL/GvpF family gas vesicle protein [Acidobacteria bacterium]|nr:GvpL/GvpF family gas vesicle protein [Acidobacteriota bacterium]
MSRKIASKKGRREAAGGGEADEALYVYCIGAQEKLAGNFEGELPTPIESKGPAKFVLIEGDGLAAVATRVPLSEYNEEALETKLRDATWMATRALRHEAVVEHFAHRASVVPLRFGTIYTGRASVEQMLGERGAQLRAIIARLEGREEWGVNVYGERAKLKDEVARLSPRLREMVERAEASTPGQAYLLRKKIDALRDDEVRAVTRRIVAGMESALAAVSVGEVRLRLLKDESNDRGELAAKLAFLVPRDGFDEFRAAAERLAAEYAPLGFSIELTGPWPPYNFASEDENAEGERGGKGKRGKGE